MDNNKIILTEAGIKKLKDEKDYLINVERPKNIEELQLARSQGDLSENADYDAARDAQAKIESRIKEIDKILENAEIISADDNDLESARIGALVGVIDLSDNDDQVVYYHIVGSTETDPINGKISNESPLGKALIGHQVGDVVTVAVAKPYEVEIKSIEQSDD